MSNVLLNACKNVGFTLIEMMIVIAIIGITSAMAIPAFLSQLRAMEAVQAENSIKGFLTTAKQDALIYHSLTTVCIANEQQVCVARGGKFLLSFIDKNDNHRFDKNIDSLQSNSPVSLVYGEMFLDIALNKIYIDFKPSNGSPIGHMGSIKYCPTDKNSKNMFKVTFSITGQIKTRKNSEEPTGC